MPVTLDLEEEEKYLHTHTHTEFYRLSSDIFCFHHQDDDPRVRKKCTFERFVNL
jgi:hypothetical protein